MGKRKSGFKKPLKKGVDSLRNAAASSSDDDEAIESHLQSVLEDEIDQYNAFKEKTLEEKATKTGSKKKKAKRSAAADDDDDEEQEVYDLGLTSSEEDEDEGGREDFMKSSDNEEDVDLEEDDDDEDDEEIMGKKDNDRGIPDSRAWGKKAKVFHNTDYVDQDFGGYEGSDAEMAELEEAEAKEIKKRLTAELSEEDFLGLIPVPDEKAQKVSKAKEVLRVDFEKMSVDEKRKLVLRECPELVHMMTDYRLRMTEASGLSRMLEIDSDQYIRKFYRTKRRADLNYCINVSYYFYLRLTSPTNCKGHPVIKRILECRKLLHELDCFSIFQYKQNQAQAQKAQAPRLNSKKKIEASLPPNKRPKLSNDDKSMEQAMLMEESRGSDEDADDSTPDKRGITYQIAKNKGLTPKRKREQRNPRVKHKEKFRKAVIRRKGQVRTPRTELQRYSGELTGIKTHLTKSIKLK